MNPPAFSFATAFGALAVSAQAQTTVCGQAEYEAMLRKSPPATERVHFPIPPGAQIDI